jgi:hypothetical protein
MNSQILYIFEETRVMKNSIARVRAWGRPHLRPRHDKKMVPIPLRAADARRSVKNILQWNCYLPPDCVRTMVRMGWDYTT